MLDTTRKKILYDIPITIEQLKNLSNGNLFQINFDNELSFTRDLIRNMMADRDDLKKIYLYFKKNNSINIDIVDIKKDTFINRVKLLLGIYLLEKSKIISVQNIDTKYLIEILPTNEKINFNDLQEYKSIQNYKNWVFSILQKTQDFY